MPYTDIECNYDAQGRISGFGNNRNDYYNIHQTYTKICAEVVCETNTLGKTYFMTEKTLRPMINGCIPLTVANAGYENYLKTLGFDMFDDVLDKNYDSVEGKVRIEKVYATLEDILINKDKLWIKQLSPRLQRNIDKVRSYIEEKSFERLL